MSQNIKDYLSRITIICNSYPPETGGAPVRIYNLAAMLRDAGYAVEIITAMPNYPKGAVFPGYRGRLTHREVMDGISIRRIAVYPSNSKMLLPRAFSMLSHALSLCLLALPRLLVRRSRLVIVSSPPLVSACIALCLARLLHIKTVLNVSDIWPASASELGAMQEGKLFRQLQRMERYMYRSADACSGQSQAIVAHIKQHTAKPVFCYRNLQPATGGALLPRPAGPRKIVYAGLLGVAQGVLDICRHTDFSALGTTLHIYGDGLERAPIAAFVAANPQRGIMLYDTVPMAQMPALLAQYHATLVPLRIAIAGAVPSKLFMAIANGLPVLWCSGGEGESITQSHCLGWTSNPGDAQALRENIHRLVMLDAEGYQKIRNRLISAAQHYFNPAIQREEFLAFIAAIPEA